MLPNGKVLGHEKSYRSTGQAVAGARRRRTGSRPRHPACMDQDARNQYLRDLREEYALASRKVKTKLLDEAGKRCGLHRKVILRKLRHPQTLVSQPRTERRRLYNAQVQTALAEFWKLFDYPYGSGSCRCCASKSPVCSSAGSGPARRRWPANS